MNAIVATPTVESAMASGRNLSPNDSTNTWMELAMPSIICVSSLWSGVDPATNRKVRPSPHPLARGQGARMQITKSTLAGCEVFSLLPPVRRTLRRVRSPSGPDSFGGEGQDGGGILKKRL